MEAEAPVVFVEPPTLVEVDADVWVVRDYDYPVYYTGGFYWVYRDGIWWRSEMYDKGWAKVEVTVVPQVIAQRDHHVYVHYKGSATAKTKVAPRDRLASDTQGPPGHDEIPGVGNQRKAEEGNPGLGNKKEEPPGQVKKEEAKAEKKEEKVEKKEEKAEKKEEKKEQKKDEKKDEKKGGPGGPKKK